MTNNDKLVCAIDAIRNHLMAITISNQVALEQRMDQELQAWIALANDLGCGPISIDRKTTSDGKSFDLIIEYTMTLKPPLLILLGEE